MMRQLRESTKFIMVIVAIAFVGLMVFEWGMDFSGQTATGGQPTDLGRVNGAEVTVDAYQRQYQILLEQAQQSSPGGLSDDELERIEQQAWDDVVNLTLLQEEARDREIEISDVELVEYIKFNPPPDMVNLPAFQSEGRFDLQKYQQALSDPALSQTWREYERQMRQTLPILRLQEQVVAGVTVTEAELRKAYLDRNERARIAYLYLDPERLVPESEVQVTDEDVRSFYEESKEEYRRAESADVRYVSFRPEVVGADSARVAALADSLAGEAREEDADFAALAEDHSDDAITAQRGGDLGWIRPEAMTPAIAEVLRTGEPGEVVGPVRSPFGWHVLKIEDRQTQEGQTRVRARQILLAIEPSSEARQAAREAARAFAQAAGGEQGAFDSAAAEHGLEVHDPPVFEKGIVVPGLGPAPMLTAFVFENPVGSISGPLEQDGDLYVVRVDRRYPAGYVAFERVAPRIRAELVRRERLERTRAIGSEITDVVRQRGLEGAAERYGLEVRTTDWFNRTNNIPGVGSGTPVAGAAFGLAEGQTAGPIETERGLYFLRVLEKDPVDPQAYEQAKPELMAQIRREKMQRMFTTWFEGLKERAEVVDNRALLLGT
ncbi:MAG: peptidyl-prolyl cis-trans isomerase [Gemmatimonadetes bacterium]|nr:peptidyl-prolyl cis-trans isomerase [Gemmatimonadota bacterium]